MISLNKKLNALLVPLICINIISGCNKKEPVKPVIKTQPETEVKVDPAPKPTEPIKEIPKFYSPYTGEEVDESTFKNIPFMVIVENSKDARPQSGIVDADIVYETSAEGGIPRMIALFQKNSPEKIGPVRSARPYFLDISREYNLPFAHCGTSAEADEIIKENKLMTLNEFVFTGFYWRAKDRKAPHNLYTSSKNIRELVETRNYIKPSNVNLKFDKTYWENEKLTAAENITFKVTKNYTTDYIFKDNKYYKTMSSTPALDKEDSRQLSVNNIVIQVTTIKLQKDGIHLDIPLTGKGYGYVISSGKMTKMAWSKENADSQTILKDESGNIISLSPGNTWWHIVDKNSTLTVK